MLELDRLTLQQGSFRLAAHLTVPTHTRTAIIGPSGAGKSTLLNAVAGFVAPASGGIRWEGQDIARLSPGDRPLSMLFQDQNLFPHLTVAQNLGLGLDPRLRLGQSQKADIAGALARVGLADKADSRPGDLSGGEQSRAALARALLRRRPMLLLDEPFAALGPGLKADMLALVAEISDQGATTVLMITHDPRDALHLCPSTILVADGIAHPPEPTAALLENPPPALRAYLGRTSL
jgi:thiamine transport system ATP-binding protein